MLSQLWLEVVKVWVEAELSQLIKEYIELSPSRITYNAKWDRVMSVQWVEHNPVRNIYVRTFMLTSKISINVKSNP